MSASSIDVKERTVRERTHDFVSSPVERKIKKDSKIHDTLINLLGFC